MSVARESRAREDWDGIGRGVRPGWVVTVGLFKNKLEKDSYNSYHQGWPI